MLFRSTADHKVCTANGWEQINHLTEDSYVATCSDILGSITYAKFHSIKYLGKQDVYNLTVEEHHNYLVNDGVLSKNCDTDRYALTCPEVRNVGGTSASFRTNTRH